MQAPRRNPVAHPKLCSGGLKRSRKAPTREMTDSEFRSAVRDAHRAFFAVRRRHQSFYSGGGFA